MIDPARPGDCKNCGGIGTLIIFLATEGPYDFPPNGKDMIAKFHNGKWWGGKSVEEACTVCHGLGRDPDYVAPPLRIRELDMAGVVTKMRSGIIPMCEGEMRWKIICSWHFR